MRESKTLFTLQVQVLNLTVCGAVFRHELRSMSEQFVPDFLRGFSVHI